jgi:hypothetical protein
MGLYYNCNFLHLRHSHVNRMFAQFFHAKYYSQLVVLSQPIDYLI